MATLGKIRRPLLRIRTPERNCFACLCVRAALSSPGGAVNRTMLARRHTTDAAGPKCFFRKSQSYLLLPQSPALRERVGQHCPMCCCANIGAGICYFASQKILPRFTVIPGILALSEVLKIASRCIPPRDLHRNST